MFDRVSAALESTRTSLWFWPVLMTLGAVGLAQGMILLDQSGWIESHPRLGLVSDALGVEWIFGTDAVRARSLLATIAASMVTIAATVFSVTIVALSLAAGQMGPRLLRTFMRDRGTQISLGMFIATFAFCLLVLGVVNSDGPQPLVPKASVTVALALALASLAVLIYFIHHVAKSIQAPEVIAVVGAELEHAIDTQFPETIAAGAPAEPAAPVRSLADLASHVPVRTRDSGYVQSIDGEGLVDLARRADVVIRLHRRPGDHVIAGTDIARIWPRAKGTDALCEQVRKAFLTGALRTPVQDVPFLVNQLVEIAQRALSAGINDPITAEACIDRLGSALGKLVQRRMPSPLRVDDEGQVRVVVEHPDTFNSLLGAAFDPIRDCSRNSRQVSVKLAALITELAPLARSGEQRKALDDQAQRVYRSARDLPEVHDRQAVEAQCRRAFEALQMAALTAPIERAAAATAG